MFLDRYAPMDAVLVRRVVACRTVIGAAIVPDHDVADAPLVAIFAIRLDHVACQFVDQIITLLRRNARDRFDLARIEIQ